MNGKGIFSDIIPVNTVQTVAKKFSDSSFECKGRFSDTSPVNTALNYL